MAHFFYIHFAFPTFFKNVFEGHIATQYLRTRSRPDVDGASNYSAGGETTLRSEASYFGPSYMIDNLWHDYHGMTIESVLINCHYPVTPTSFLLQWGAIVRRPPGLSDAQADRVAAKFADFVGLGFQQDVEIWRHKSRIDNPLLCAEDGPVYQVRRWYEQFYRTWRTSSRTWWHGSSSRSTPPARWPAGRRRSQRTSPAPPGPPG